jgi:hypothetical protein
MCRYWECTVENRVVLWKLRHEDQCFVFHDFWNNWMIFMTTHCKTVNWLSPPESIFYVFTVLLLVIKQKCDQKSVSCRTHGEMINAFKMFLRKPQRKLPLGKPECLWELENWGLTDVCFQLRTGRAMWKASGRHPNWTTINPLKPSGKCIYHLL